jgi:hypothetical protein
MQKWIRCYLLELEDYLQRTLGNWSIVAWNYSRALKNWTEAEAPNFEWFKILASEQLSLDKGRHLLPH